MRRVLAAAALAVAAPAQADIALRLPVACTLGETCFIQNHVDTDPGPGHRDFACGHLSYDGHDGTDFTLPTLADMARGVAVLAPADGTVTGTRDGMPDIAFNAPGAPPLDGRDCGNGVAIDHGGGYVTQLCHLAQGSVLVRRGERVAAGQPLGRIGLSGRSEFPHVHLSLRKDGRAVDPFRPETTEGCDPAPAPGLWAEPLAYLPAALTGAGIATDPPDFAQVLAGLPTPDLLQADGPALVVWAVVMGPKAGDRLSLRLTGPQGPLHEQTVTLDRDQARAFRFSGRRTPAGGWPPGPYRAEIALIRDNRVLDRAEVASTLR
ncbi:MAG: M23 family metallopeptidase [Gemmobacter sp.]|uniref:M23 family metallopeptidase n=1 Tax=Gemmobacter sp. TaxID=1898957 RepID=UPI00391B9F63